MSRLFVLLAALFARLSALAGTPGPGDYRNALPAGGEHRSDLVHLPPQPASGALPVVLSLHGGGGNAEPSRRIAGGAKLRNNRGATELELVLPHLPSLTISSAGH